MRRSLAACMQSQPAESLERDLLCIVGSLAEDRSSHVMFVRLCGSLPRELTLLVRAHSLMSGKPRPRYRFEDRRRVGRYHWTRYQHFLAIPDHSKLV